eukprot:TRINITY_DN9828_c0_g3_i1.p1 TRINITY_DN9828_c0_g3~~TRINITY_DN9828_c0_g3_i1.p1  ORF type:complete len:103 (+),score=0.31 TRINITY_DN9828_c0_g3_i1:21-329(+)
MLSKMLISNFILSSFTTHQPQHSHICCIYFVHMLLLDWPIVYSIGNSWSGHCLIEFFLQLCWNSVIKHSRRKSPFQTSYFYPMLNTFINLPILANYRTKVME